MSLPLNLKNLSEKLQHNIPGNYRLDWAGTLKSPIRYKTNTTKDTAKVLNVIWANAISKVTGCKYVTEGKYIRLNSDYLDDTITFTIYTSGTIMIQGNSSLKWADRYIDKLYKIVQSEIEDRKSEMNNTGESSILEQSFEVKGVCALCDQEDDDEMMHCDIKTCNAWVHNKCEGLNEQQAREVKPYYCRHCRSTYNLKITRKTISDALPISSTQPPSIVDINLSNPEILEELSENNTQNNSSLEYLKNVHTNLENLNSEESLNSSDSVIEELKNLTKNVAEAFKEEIKQREKNNSVNTTQKNSLQHGNTLHKTDLDKNERTSQTKVSQSTALQIDTDPINNKERTPQTKASLLTSSPIEIDETPRIYLSAEKKLQKSQNQNKSLNTRLQTVTNKLISTEGQLIKANQEIGKLKAVIQVKSETLHNNQVNEENLIDIKKELNHLKITKDSIKEELEKTCKENKLLKDIQHQYDLKMQDLNQIISQKENDSSHYIEQIKALNETISEQNQDLSRKSNEIEHLKGRLNNFLKKLKCKSSLHEVEGYCEFRDAEQITQLKLNIKKLNEEKTALLNQTLFDDTVKANLDDLLNKADARVNQLRKNEAELMKRNRELVRQIEMVMNNAGHEKNSEIANSEYDTVDSLSDTNSERNMSNDESERKISTPVRKKPNDDSKTDQNKKSIPLTDPAFTEVLYSLESQLKKFFNENRKTNENLNTNSNYYHHDPNNKRNRPICKFYTNKGCNSDRCIYYHPPNLNSSINCSQPPLERSRRYSQSKKDEICWFYQRNICKYDENECQYLHLHNY